MPTVVSELFTPNLLDKVSILAVTAPSDATASPGESFGRAVAEGAERLGAHVRTFAPDAVLVEPGGGDMLVVDSAALFASGGLRTCLDSTWDATRAVVNGVFLPADSGGRIVYIAPVPGAGEGAEAARAGLENLARTLSVEWARHGITTVTIAPGAQSAGGEVGALVAYLASPAGAYFSGCQLDLGGVVTR
ncbi:MAG TPA: hypothetical protein VGH60_04855 [Solirubrobacteraceae bacterium]|jgi:NAD(P)-dependent dehydrogenase (short-subunit alcohol dehydrogenase family)